MWAVMVGRVVLAVLVVVAVMAGLAVMAVRVVVAAMAAG